MEDKVKNILIKKTKWKALLKQATIKNPNFKEPPVPYVDTHIVGEHNGLNNGNIAIMWY